MLRNPIPFSSLPGVFAPRGGSGAAVRNANDVAEATFDAVSRKRLRRKALVKCAGFAALLIAMFGALESGAQFGPPEPQGHGPKLPEPTVFPQPGSYPTTESVTFLEKEPGTTIHYTLDGSNPTAKSPVFDPMQVLFLTGIYEGDHGLKAGYTLRAVAMKEGNTNSDIANFQFVIDRRDRSAYVSEEVLPGVRMARDSDNDKMFLVRGTTKDVLIDSGQGRGKLKEYLSQYTGGRPIEVIFTHNHGDHIGQADQFVQNSIEHIGEADRPALERLLKSRNIPDEVVAKNVVSAHDGDQVDLGDRKLVIYEAPGHTRGSLVIFDEKNGYLFTGDSYGSNSPTIPDALWMQGSQVPLDKYLSMILVSRANFRGKVKYVMTGHNDHPLAGEVYLDNLQSATQSLMDKGDAALVPSYRPTGLQQVVVGDRFTDPDWVAINVNHDHYLPAPVNSISSLALLSVAGGKLSPVFDPAVTTYHVELPAKQATARVTAQPTSTRSTLTADGKDVLKSGGADVPSNKNAVVEVKSPDGTKSTTYTIEFSNAAQR